MGVLAIPLPANCWLGNDEATGPHSSFLSSCSPQTRQSGAPGAGARSTGLGAGAGRRAISQSARESRLAGKIGGVRGANGGVVALTRIFTGQQIARAAGILMLVQRGCFCMPSPWLQSGKLNREGKPESFVEGSPDVVSGNHLTRRPR